MAQEKVWWYAKGGEKFGPYSGIELKTLATDGKFGMNDLIWKEGLKEWLPASSVKGLIPASGTVAPPPLPVTAQQSTTAEPPAYKERESKLSQGIQKSAPAAAASFWNPLALSNWSFILTPVFGAYLVTENYKAMGKTTEAKKSMDWLYITIAVVLGGWVLVSFSFDVYTFGIFMAAYVTNFLIWNFRSARKQHQYLLSEYGKNYERQPWGKVLVIGIAANIVYQVILRSVGF